MWWELFVMGSEGCVLNCIEYKNLRILLENLGYILNALAADSYSKKEKNLQNNHEHTYEQEHTNVFASPRLFRFFSKVSVVRVLSTYLRYVGFEIFGARPVNSVYMQVVYR